MASKDDFVVVSKKELFALQKKVLAGNAALDDANDIINALTSGGQKQRKPRAPKTEAPAPTETTAPASEPQDFDEAPAKAPAAKSKPATVTPIKGAANKALVKKGFAPAMPGKKAG